MPAAPQNSPAAAAPSAPATSQPTSPRPSPTPAPPSHHSGFHSSPSISREGGEGRGTRARERVRPDPPLPRGESRPGPRGDNRARRIRRTTQGRPTRDQDRTP